MASSGHVAAQDAVFTHGFEPVGPPTREEAARFLNQATFGATVAEIDRLMAIGYDAWFAEQFARPRGRTYYQWQQVDRFNNPTPANDPNINKPVSAWYTRAVRGEDQLRQRMTWALSQIFVVSGADTQIAMRPYQYLPTYMDLLADNAFGRYRTTLENVTLAPLMGLMLTYKENRETAAVPADQNFAREIMQLFSIGLYRLNPDGTRQLDAQGNPIANYGLADIVGLARVFTGWDQSSGGAGENDLAPVVCGNGGNDTAEWLQCPMAARGYHSMAEKRFLGVVIPANPATGNSAVFAQARSDLRIALDTLHAHPSTAPFISRQLIQRFTTSNPSPAYVQRVAQVFADNGAGVRGDFRAVLKAILLDRDARDPVLARSPTWGKVREPILGATHMMRVLRTNDGFGNVWAGNYNCVTIQDIYSEVLEAPFHPPTVFNFYRPGFVPPNSRSGQLGLVAPELQITDTVNVAHWSRFVTDSLSRDGTGGGGGCRLDNRFDYGEFWSETVDPVRLVDRVELLLLPGATNPTLRGAMLRAVQSVPGTSDAARRNRLRIALSIALINPEYRVQR